jgi:hypothetical protein
MTLDIRIFFSFFITIMPARGSPCACPAVAPPIIAAPPITRVVPIAVMVVGYIVALGVTARTTIGAVAAATRIPAVAIVVVVVIAVAGVVLATLVVLAVILVLVAIPPILVARGAWIAWRIGVEWIARLIGRRSEARVALHTWARRRLRWTRIRSIAALAAVAVLPAIRRWSADLSG